MEKNKYYYEGKEHKNFRELLCASVDYYGERPMFVEKDGDADKTYSAEQFRDLVYNLGSVFCELGLLDEKVAVIGETSVKWVSTYFATACGAGVVVPVDKELPDDEIANVLNDSGATAIVYSPSYEGVMQNIKDTVPNVRYFIGMEAKQTSDRFVSYDDFIKKGEALSKDDYLAREIDENKMSSLLYTSGTTGKSKGVMLTQKNVLNSSESPLSLIKFGEKCMSVLPVHHSYEFSLGIMMSISAGITICINDSLRYFFQNLQRFKPDSMCLVPLFAEMIHRKIWTTAQQNGTEQELKDKIAKSNELLAQGIDKRDEFFKDIKDSLGGNLKWIVVGGAPLAKFYVKEFADIGIELLQGYGITECAPLVCINSTIKEVGNVAGAAGYIIPCNEVQIREQDESGEGEVWVSGSNVMLGYYKNPQATAEVMDGEWFNTGDIGRVDGEGFLYITGRKKNLIVLTNGKNVYPEEIEGYMMRVPYIKEIIVYAPMEDGMAEEKLLAEIFVDEAYSKDKTKEEICDNLRKDIATVNKTLPGYKQVKDFTLRDREFEKTTKKSIKRFVMGKK